MNTPLNIAARTVTFVNNTISSQILFADAQVLTIVHNNADYKLRLTGQGKLILTK